MLLWAEVNGNCFCHNPRFPGHDFFPATTQPGRRPVDVAPERLSILSDHDFADHSLSRLNHAFRTEAFYGPLGVATTIGLA